MAARWLHVAPCEADFGADRVTEMIDLSWAWPQRPDTSTPEQERRWRISVEVATKMSAFHEPDGVADPWIVAIAARALFDSPIPTD
jgi:hypothetical protein